MTVAGYSIGRDEESGLTDRERLVLAGILIGQSFSEIGEPLGITRQRAGQIASALVKKGVVVRTEKGYVLPEIHATREAWHLQEEPVVVPLRDGTDLGDSEYQSVVLLDAAANTGSRYLVLVTPTNPRVTGGGAVVSVLEPWQAAYATSGSVTDDYVADRWSGGDQRAPRDIAALAMTINMALVASAADVPVPSEGTSEADVDETPDVDDMKHGMGTSSDFP